MRFIFACLVPLGLMLAFGVVPGSLACAAETDGIRAAAKNPIAWTDIPDLAVIRVGDTYYMSSTTMHLSPGLPIMKSMDLVNWQIVGYAYNTLGDNDALSLRNGKNAYGAGSWASSLRYHNGTFYATTFSSTTGKTHVYRTKDIEKGPWTENSFRPALHDHSLFFDDDGRVYMIFGAGNLRLVELTADVSAIKPGGVDQVIITNASRVAGPNVGLPAEGSQMLKVNGKYYLLNITWPRGGMRTVIVHRADKITGPYEGRVALQDKGVAQGGLVDSPQDDWYAYLFRDYGAVGRVPYLVPVKWKDGWPVLGVDGKVPDALSLPASNGLIPGIIASDEFNRRPGEVALPLVWQWNHNPDDHLWSVTQRPGYLRLTTGRVDDNFLAARNTLTQRMFGPECSAIVCIDVSNMKDGDFAGLGALQRRYGLVGVKKAGNSKSIVMVSAESGSPVEFENVQLTHDIVYLKLECDFRSRADTARFYHSIDGKQWTAIGRPLRMTYTLPHFMGYRFALFNFATKTAGGFVDFDFFRVSDKIELANYASAADGGFLFTTFRDETTPMSEQIYMGISEDGRHWDAIKGGNPVLVSDVGEKGVRDSFLLRSHDGQKVWLIATDLSVARNRDWKRATHSGSRSIVVWESSDLMLWSPPRLALVAPSDAGCVWAPEAIYDEDTRDYLVCWASTTSRDNFAKQRIWAAHTKDFRSFGTPFMYDEKPNNVIDIHIVRDGKSYYRFTKDDRLKTVSMETSKKLMGSWQTMSQFTAGQGKNFEGPICFRLKAAADGQPPAWCLLLDNVSDRIGSGAFGYMPFITHDLSTGHFMPATDFHFPFPFRHGAVLPITTAERERLQSAFSDNQNTAR